LTAWKVDDLVAVHFLVDRLAVERDAVEREVGQKRDADEPAFPGEAEFLLLAPRRYREHEQEPRDEDHANCCRRAVQLHDAPPAARRLPVAPWRNAGGNSLGRRPLSSWDERSGALRAHEIVIR
jgi:hypothetical protein